MLILDETTKTIFLHNPKCGGTYIKQMYLNNHPWYPAGLHRPKHYYLPEIHVHGAHIDYCNLPRFIPDYQDYKIISFIRNPFNRFISALHWSANANPLFHQLMTDHANNIKSICQYLISLNYEDQDKYIRNYKIPWTMPQSRFFGHGIITLKYESSNDWNFLFNLYRITNAEIRIKTDYMLDDETKNLIKQLYYDDQAIFDYYSY